MVIEEQVPKVAVWMLTYNHEHYIKRSIDAILAQQTNFTFKIYLGEDCSTDATGDICASYAKEFPGKIDLTKNPKNLGSYLSAMNIYDKCFSSGASYIALCEGDDYWTDPLKLQKQVDFMDAHPNVGLCFHRANILRKDGSLSLHPIPAISDTCEYEYADLLEQNNFITTASVLFRNPTNFMFPTWFTNIPFGDLGLYKLVTNKKRGIKCLDEVMSVYRIHGEGIYSKLSTLEKIEQYLSFYKTIYPFLNKEEQNIVDNKRAKRLKKMSNLKYPKYKWMRFFYKKYLALKYPLQG